MKKQRMASLVLVSLVWSRLALGGSTAPHSPPLGLHQVIELALTHNPDLTAESARLGEAEARLAEASSAFFPKLSGRVGYEYTNDPSRAFAYVVAQRRFDFGMSINHPGWVDNFRPELVGSWSLYRGGQDQYRRQAAELGIEVAALERQAVQNRLTAAVTAAYYAWLTAPEQIAVARQSLRSIETERLHTRKRVDEGMALKADVLSLEVRLAASREAEIRAENALTLARSSLQVLVGTELPATLNQATDTTGIPPVSETITTLLEQAVTQRPEMQAATRQIAIRQAELQAERGALMPKVNAYAAYGLNSRGPDMDFNRDNMTVGVNAEVDLFSGGAIRARIAGAEQRLAVAEATGQRTRLNIEDEVRKAYATLDETLKRITTTELGQQAAEEALRLVHLQYQSGSASVSRYLEVETDRAEASLRAIMARYEARIAKAQLEQAIGRMTRLD